VLVDLTIFERSEFQVARQKSTYCLAKYVAAFMAKSQLFQQQTGSGNFMHFPTFQLQLQKNQDIDKKFYIGKLDALIEYFDSQF